MKSIKIILCLTSFLFSSMFIFGALDVKFTTTIAQTPDPAAAGNEATFSVSFKNFGAAVSNYKITGGVDGTKIFERVYASIAADKVKTDSFKWTAAAGDHKVWFDLDPEHKSGDTNWANNKIEKAFTVSGGQTVKPIVKQPDKKIWRGNPLPSPDGLPLSMDVFVKRIFLEDEDGDPVVTVKANTWFKCEVRRIGPAPAKNYWVKLYVDGNQIQCHATSCLVNPEDTTKIAYGHTWIDTPGDHEFKCVAELNWNDMLNEPNKTNNTMVQIINIPSSQ
jgi:subtilase family serine protease